MSTERELRFDHTLGLLKQAEMAVLKGMHFSSASKAQEAIGQLEEAIDCLVSVHLIQASEARQLREDRSPHPQAPVWSQHDVPQFLRPQAE